METTIADIGSVRHKLDGMVMVDRDWARQLGAHLAKGARRVGNFYRLPRIQYLRLLEATANSAVTQPAAVHPALRWTASDDLAVANMLQEAAQEPSQPQAVRQDDAECVGCS
ncbi:MAG TPA: hypothetical protein VHJ78_13515 [Actinomycetota bacterium]|nr:hypothetical protein [Actinomycetota bacterium]